MICLPPECGGLGLFKFDKFLGSQKCFRILNADRSLRDNWRCCIFSWSFGNCFVSAAEELIRCFILYCMVSIPLLENLGSAMTVLLKTI
jgi:hypothetical protein